MHSKRSLKIKIVKNDSLISYPLYQVISTKVLVIKLQFTVKQMYIPRLFKTEMNMYHRIINTKTLLIFRFVILNLKIDTIIEQLPKNKYI
jgi:hypothetical protein